MPRIIIAIIDTLAKDIIGPIQVFAHPAPAVRMFSDVANDNRTAIHNHVEDHELVMLGTLNEDLTVTADYKVIITGAQWRAAQQEKENNS